MTSKFKLPVLYLACTVRDKNAVFRIFINILYIYYLGCVYFKIVEFAPEPPVAAAIRPDRIVGSDRSRTMVHYGVFYYSLYESSLYAVKFCNCSE